MSDFDEQSYYRQAAQAARFAEFSEKVLPILFGMTYLGTVISSIGNLSIFILGLPLSMTDTAGGGLLAATILLRMWLSAQQTKQDGEGDNFWQFVRGVLLIVPVTSFFLGIYQNVI